MIYYHFDCVLCWIPQQVITQLNTKNLVLLFHSVQISQVMNLILMLLCCFIQADKVAQLLSGSSKMVGNKLCQHHQHSHKGHQHETVELQKVDHHFSSSKDCQNNTTTSSPPNTESLYVLNYI